MITAAGMNWLDYILIAVFVVFALTSARKGFSREVIGLAAALLALVLGMWFYPMAASLVAPYTGSARVANLIGFLVVVAAVMLCGGMLGWIVSRFLRTIGLSFFDRLLGAAFGAVKGFLIAMAVLTAFTAFGPYVDSETVSSAMVHSQIAPWILEASRVVVAIAPMDLKVSFSKQYSRLKAAVQERGKTGNDK